MTLAPIHTCIDIVHRFGRPNRTGAIECYEATASLSAIRHTPVANGAVPTSIEL
jgi:hypothetical protein